MLDGQWNVLSSTSAATGCSTVDVNQQQQLAAAAADADDDSDKRSKNRSAARRCRMKRLERQQTMGRQVADVGADNERLRANIGRLRRRIEHLQSVLSEHRLHGPCRLHSCAASSADDSSTLDL